MGQDISTEMNKYLKRGLNLQDYQGHVVNVQVENLSKKWMLKALVLEKRVIPYRRSRTELGAPIICRLESTKWTLDNIIRYNDGFPLPSTTDDLNAFDSEIFVDSTHTVEVPIKHKYQRSKSIPNLSVLRARIPKLQLQAPSKPKFLDKLFNNVGLYKKSQGKLKNGLVIYSRRQENSTEENPEEFENSDCQRPSEADDSDVFSDTDCDVDQSLVEEFSQPINKTWSTPNSPKVVGIVQQRVKDFQELASGHSCVRSRSLSTPSSPHFKRRSIIRESDQLLLYTADCEDSSVSIFCSGLLRNEHCRKMSGGAVRKYVHELDSKNATVQKTEKRVSHVKDLVEQFDSSASEKKSDKPEQNVNGQTAQIQPLSPKTSSSHNRQTAPVKPSVQLPTNLKAGVNPVKPVIPNSPLQSPKLPQFIPKSPPLCPNKPVKNLQVTKPTGYVKPQVHDKPQAHSNTSNLIQKDPTTETNKEIDKSEKLSADVDQSVSEEALVKPSSIASHENKNDTKPAGTSSPRLPKKPVSIKSGKCQNVTAPETESKNFENATENCATENCATENVVTDSTTVESTTTEIDESVTEVTSVDKDHVTENVVQYDDTRIYANSEVACAHENLNGTINGSSEEPLNRSFDEHVDETGNNANSKEIQRQISDMFDSSWSDSDFAEFSDSDNEECEDKPEEKKEKCVGECKLRKIANELQQTERAYVKKLVLVNETFQAKIKEENDQQKFFPPEVIPQMFSNIGSIRQFHELHFLPSLDKRMDKWEAEPKIGDLMKNNAPFLKMYTEYVKNFDHATNLISFWMEKSTKFAAVIKEIQKKPECCCLTLQHHMLEPIQRVPRYEMLLKDYIKHLPEDSDDLNDAKVALQKVTQAAQHSNEAMKKIEKFHKLLEIKEKIATTMDLISPTRELIREGRIKKISARGGERLDRYLFLFNDLLLICCEPLLGSYKIKAELEMDGLEIMERTDKTVRWILEGENMDIPNTFYVKSTQKIIQFLDENSAGETTGWSESIKTVIKEFRLRKQSIHGIENESACDSISETDIGKVAPRWIKDDEVTMCMSCTKQFTGIRRRHHCRACGKVVCGRCSGKKAALIYDNNRPNRVCDKCYGVLKHHSVNSDTVLKSKHTPKLLQKQANEPSVLSGYLHKSTDKGKTWCKRWISVCSDFVMYEFKAHQDVCALSCIPLPGYQVEVVESMENVFKITHQKQNIFFQPENTAGKERWTEVLRKIVNLQLPDEANEESNRNSVQSTDSSSGGPDSSQNTDKQAEIE